MFLIRFLAVVLLGIVPAFAGDVTVDASGNLVVGTDPDATGGEALRTSGALRASNVLSLSATNAVTITGTYTCPATAFGKWHLISGTSANYFITLPAAVGNIGKCIGFRVMDASRATKTYSILAAGSELIDGSATQDLAANGTLVLMSDGVSWARIGGTSTGSGTSQIGTGGSGASLAGLTDWTSYTPSFTNCGTQSEIEFYWRRVGDTIEIQGKFLCTVNAPAAMSQISLPSGITIDGSKLGSDVANNANALVGQLSGNNAGYAVGYVLAADGESVLKFSIGYVSGFGPLFAQNGQPLFGAGNRYTLNAKVPVAGWSVRGRCVHVEARTSVAQALTGGTTNIIFGSKDCDTQSSLSATTGVFTAPLSGIYQISAAVTMSNAASYILLYKNGNYARKGSSPGGSAQAPSALSLTMNLTAGDQLSIRYAASSTLNGVAAENYLSITHISD